MSRLLKEFIISVSAILVCGCSVSQYHLGYHYLGGDSTLYSVVSGEVEGMTFPLEQAMVNYLSTYDLMHLKQHFAPKLANSINDSDLNMIGIALKDSYTFNGKSKRLMVIEKSFMLDEGNMKKPFEFYDFVGASYLLYGKNNAVATFFMTQIDGVVKLCGFEIKDEKPKGNNPIISPGLAFSSISAPKDKVSNQTIRHLFPESIDKGKMIGRKFIIAK